MTPHVLSNRPVIEADDLPRLESLPLNAQSVEAIIAAAGRGTRLASALPKILVLIDGQTLLMRLLDRLSGLVGSVTLVVSPSGRSAVEAAIPSLLSVPIAIVEQPEPTGMADAVLAAVSHRSHASPPERPTAVAVIWGDQAGLTRRTVRLALLAHQHHPNRPAITLPVVELDQPYVHYVLDERQQVVAVHQAREGDALPPRGLADCGCFVAEREPLTRALHDLRAGGALRGRVTGEQNFLPVVPHFGRLQRAVVVKCAQIEDSFGINTVADLERVRGSQGAAHDA